MLTDNRDLIADILDGLACKISTDADLDDDREWDRSARLESGANLLRWTAAFEAEAERPDIDERAELEHLRDQFEAISEALIARDGKGKPMTPFAFRKLVAQVLA